MTKEEQEAQAIIGHIGAIWNAIAGLQEERPYPTMPEKIAVDSLKNSVRLVKHNFLFSQETKHFKREKREAVFNDFDSISLSESEIITINQNTKKVRIDLEKYITELPKEISSIILKKLTGEEEIWYTLFLGVQSISIHTRLPNWAGMGVYRDKRFTSLDVLMHKMLPLEFGELFESGLLQRANFVKTEKYYDFLPICIHKTLGQWFTKHPSAKTVVADIWSVIPEWDEVENENGEKETVAYPSYHFIELRRRDTELPPLRAPEKIPEWILEEDPIHIRLTLQEIRAKQFFQLRQILSCNVPIIGGDDRILISYDDKENQFPKSNHLLQNLRHALDNKEILASDYVKIETGLDLDDPCLENLEDTDGIDFFDDLDSVGWENLENHLDR